MNQDRKIKATWIAAEALNRSGFSYEEIYEVLCHHDRDFNVDIALQCAEKWGDLRRRGRGTVLVADVRSALVEGDIQ